MDRRAVSLVFALWTGAAAPAPGQAPTGIKRSQHGTLSQAIASADVRVIYNRPVARGRTLFGGVVAWGRVWNPGADSATTISFSHDMLVNQRPLPAGEYTLWARPDPKAWTLIFSKATHIWHTPYPGVDQDALRVDVVPQSGPHMETLAFYFPMVDGDSATLALQWGTTIVPLALKVRR